MNKTFKRALSSALALVMAFSCMIVMNVSSAFAEETGFSFDFRTGSLISSSDGTGTFYITGTSNDSATVSTTATEDYTLKIGSVKYNDGTYGVCGGGFTVEFQVTAPAEIVLGTADYYMDFTASSTDSTAKFAYADDCYYATEFNTFGTKGGSKTIYYEGTGTATVTLTALATKTNYLPFISVNTVDSIPELSEKPADVTADITATFTADGNTITSGTVEVFGATCSTDENGQASFEGVKVGSYEVRYNDGTDNYSGTLVIAEGDTEATVELTKITATNIDLLFTGGDIISSSGTYYIVGSEAYTDAISNYDVKVGNVKYANSNYGIYGGVTAFSIELKDIVGPCEILLGATKYGGTFSAAVTAGSGSFVDENGLAATEISCIGASSSYNAENLGKIYYTGTDKATIKFTGTAGSVNDGNNIYLPYIGVTTVTSDDIPVALPTVTATLNAGGSAVSGGTATVLGCDYNPNESGQISLENAKAGSYEVRYNDGTDNYSGTLVIAEGNTEATVDLTKITATNIDLLFTGGDIISSDSIGTYYIVGSEAYTDAISNYDVKVGNVGSHNSNYGIVGGATAVSIELKDIVGPCEISLGATDYGGTFSANVTAGSGSFVDENGLAATEISCIGTEGNYTLNDLSKIYYTGTDKATITLTGTSCAKGSSTYLPYIGVTTVTSESIPSQTANNNIRIAAANAKEGDYVELVDSEGNQFVKQIGSNGYADFSGSAIAFGDVTYEVIGYTLPSDVTSNVNPDVGTISVSSSSTDFNVNVTSKATETVSGDTVSEDLLDANYLYAGFAATDGYKTYTTIQDAVNAATVGDTIVIADGTYHEVYGITVETSDITLESASKDASKVIIWDNDYENGDMQKGFHGDTLLVNATGFTANNITVENNIEETYEDAKLNFTSKNTTALGIGSKGATASAVLNNCNILATRDTIYTGTTANNTSLTMNNCKITGFQDTICGSGTLVMNDCTMDPTLGVKDTAYTTSTARLLIPRGTGAVYTVNNLTIEAVGNGSNPIYFGRPWDEADTGSILIVNGYTIADNAKTAFNAALAAGSYGFSPDGISVTGATKNFLWLVREKKDTGVYNTTLSTLDNSNYVSFDSVTAEDNTDSIYKLVGKVAEGAKEFINSTITDLGFSITGSKNGGTEKITNVDGILYSDEDENYYTVNFIECDTQSNIYTYIPYVTYNGYDIAVGGSEALFSE